MLHIATVHYKSARWIPVQMKYLRDNVPVAYETWTSLEGIDPAEGVHFDHVLDQKAPHPEKLNHLAIEIRHAGADEDVLMFLDGDAFPIADLTPLLQARPANPLIAVRREENSGEPYPHPCFCLTTVGFWRTLPGDWSRGYTWRSQAGTRFSDVGANLWRTLQLQQIPWLELKRSNQWLAGDIRFGIYGEVLYHHGSGFHAVSKSSRDEPGPRVLRTPANRLLAAPVRHFNRRRRRRWQERSSAVKGSDSEQVFARLAAGEVDFLRAPRAELQAG